MNDVLDFDDVLEPLGTVVGVLLVLIGLATVAGTPWTTSGAVAGGLQSLGALGTAAVGAGLVWLSRL